MWFTGRLFVVRMQQLHHLHQLLSLFLSGAVTAVILQMDGHIHAGHGFAGDWEIL
jgi:hypothetical protein